MTCHVYQVVEQLQPIEFQSASKLYATVFHGLQTLQLIFRTEAESHTHEATISLDH